MNTQIYPADTLEADKKLGSISLPSYEQSKPRSLLGMPKLAQYANVKEVRVTSQSPIYMQLATSQKPIACQEVTVHWPAGLELKVGSLVPGTDTKEGRAFAGDYVLEATGFATSTYQEIAREHARRNDPHVTFKTPSGEEVTMHQLPGSVKVYGTDCAINLK